MDLDDSDITELLVKHKIDKLEDITAEKFADLYLKEKDHPLFKWFNQLTFNSGLINIADGSQEAKPIKESVKSPSLPGLSSTERKRLEWFFKEKLVSKNDAKQSEQVLDGLFKDVRMP